MRRQKAILTFGVALKISCCPVWAIGYGSLGLYLVAAAPIAYMILSAGSTARFLTTRQFGPYGTRQMILMLALPAAMQYALGGFVSGSAVILWSLLAPLMALVFHGVRQAVPWLVAFLVLVAVSGVLEFAGIVRPAPIPPLLHQAFFVLNVSVVGLVVCATVRYFGTRLETEQARSERLLFNLLPRPIIDRLKAGEETIADTCSEVSVLFADLVGFTSLTTRVAPTEMVRMLNRLFSAFDVLVQQHGLEKIKTIGDGYHAVAGLPVPRPDHAAAAAELALGMQAAVRELAAESGWPLDLRIGIDSGGPVIAGVIGTQKYVYEVWGDVVNTASRMESQGVAGAIQVTEATYYRLRDRYSFEDRGLMEIKSKGPMRTFLLVGRRAASEVAAPAITTPTPLPAA